jgi:hypothetical protein
MAAATATITSAVLMTAALLVPTTGTLVDASTDASLSDDSSNDELVLLLSLPLVLDKDSGALDASFAANDGALPPSPNCPPLVLLVPPLLQLHPYPQLTHHLQQR